MHRLTGTLAMLGVAAAAKPANMNGELLTSARLVWGGSSCVSSSPRFARARFPRRFPRDERDQTDVRKLLPTLRASHTHRRVRRLLARRYRHALEQRLRVQGLRVLRSVLASSVPASHGLAHTARRTF